MDAVTGLSEELNAVDFKNMIECDVIRGSTGFLHAERDASVCLQWAPSRTSPSHPCSVTLSPRFLCSQQLQLTETDPPAPRSGTAFSIDFGLSLVSKAFTISGISSA